MIVVIGSLSGRRDGGRLVADGLAARIAIEAAGSGRRVQIVGRIGDDAAADAVLHDLARAGVDHVAILRDPARATPISGHGAPSAPPVAPELDGADVELALRYLTDFRVVVLVQPVRPSVTAVVARAVDWAGAAFVVVGAAENEPTDLPDGVQRLEQGTAEDPPTFTARVAGLAAALDVDAATEPDG